MFRVTFHFHGDLGSFLRRGERHGLAVREMKEKTSVKDAIESCGVPHTEVDLIVVDGQSVDFSFQLQGDVNVAVHPFSSIPRETFPDTHLQAPAARAFVADGHLQKLARHLRLLGVDVICERDATDAELLERMTRESRALLTRDRRLLMHRIVQTGYCPRSQNPIEQTTEVLRRFALAESIAPFSRCLRCNAPLRAVSKNDVLEELEPLTRVHFNEFRRCTSCGQVYWPGSHFLKLERQIAAILAAL